MALASLASLIPSAAAADVPPPVTAEVADSAVLVTVEVIAPLVCLMEPVAESLSAWVALSTLSCSFSLTTGLAGLSASFASFTSALGASLATFLTGSAAGEVAVSPTGTPLCSGMEGADTESGVDVAFSTALSLVATRFEVMSGFGASSCLTSGAARPVDSFAAGTGAATCSAAGAWISAAANALGTGDERGAAPINPPSCVMTSL
ncbi:Uncharacterised protein [Mycobacteroides abscessus]|nr:Uncharacterised protein [Mycobacteroides abscessus]